MKSAIHALLALFSAVAFLSCSPAEEVEETKAEEPAISINPTSISAPFSGGVYEVSVVANFKPISISGTTDWIECSENGEGKYSVTIAATPKDGRKAILTFYNETRSAKANLSIEQAENTKYVEPEPPTPTAGIFSAEDLVAFAQDVNSGASLEKWMDEQGEICLRNDIDMSEVKSWTPIGNACVAAATTYTLSSGKAFSGKFNGNTFSIKNFKQTITVAENNFNCGLFGTLAPGAQIKDLTIDESCSLIVNANATCCCGMVAGLGYGAELSNVDNHGSFSVVGASSKANSGKDTGLVYAGGIIGGLYSGVGNIALLERCHNTGALAFNNSDASKIQTYKGYHIAGIAGFIDNGDKDNRIVVTECSNTTNIETNALRSAGIIATAANHIDVINSENRGKMTNKFNVKWYGIAGGVVGVAGTYCSVSGCSNYGDMICTVYGVPGGIISNVTGNGVEVSECSNYGNTMSGCAARALIIGMLNADKSAKVRNCYVDGKTGSIVSPNTLSNPGWDEYTAADKDKAICYLKDGASCECINNTFGFDTSSKPVVDYENAKLKVLFIGNSFTVDAVNQLPKFVSDMGLDEIQMTNMYYAGRPIVDHYSGYDTNQSDYTCYQCGPGRSSWVAEANKTSLKAIVKATDWDIITIQECTGHVGGWVWTEYFPNINMTEAQLIPAFVNLLKRDCPNKNVKLYYIMSQAYGKTNKTKLVSRPDLFTNQDEMYACIVSVGRKVMETGLFEGIAATGTMMQNLRASSMESPRDFTRDTYHMDNGVSRFTAAALMFETVISPTSYAGGVKLDNCKYRIPNGYVESSDCCTPVTDENFPFCLKVARATMAQPFEVTVVNP